MLPDLALDLAGRPEADEPIGVRVEGVAVGDIVKVAIGGRIVYGEVSEIRDRVVYFRPISPAAGWRHASAHQVVGHWRKAGRRRSGGEEDIVAQPPQQLALRVNS